MSTIWASRCWAGRARSLPTPSALLAAAVSSTGIDLGRTDSAIDESGSDIERSSDQSGWNLVGAVGANETSYLDTELAVETECFFRVAAYNHICPSAPSNTASGTTLPFNGGADDVASSDIDVSGTVTGSYLDTWAGDGDDVLFAYSSDDSTYLPMLTKEVDDGNYQSFV